MTTRQYFVDKYEQNPDTDRRIVLFLWLFLTTGRVRSTNLCLSRHQHLNQSHHPSRSLRHTSVRDRRVNIPTLVFCCTVKYSNTVEVTLFRLSSFSYLGLSQCHWKPSTSFFCYSLRGVLLTPSIGHSWQVMLNVGGAVTSTVGLMDLSSSLLCTIGEFEAAASKSLRSCCFSFTTFFSRTSLASLGVDFID
jgi:hypothetical protein